METLITSVKVGGSAISRPEKRATISKADTAKTSSKEAKVVTSEVPDNSFSGIEDKTTISDNALKALGKKNELEATPPLESKVDAGVSNTTQKAMGVSANRVDFSVDSDNNVVVQLIDSETNEVVRSIPPEEQGRIGKALERILEQAKQISERNQNSSIENTI